MKNVFVTIVQESLRADRFEMTIRSIFNCDRFDPMDCILQNEKLSKFENDLVRQHRIGGRSANVQEKGTVCLKKTLNLCGPLATPG